MGTGPARGRAELGGLIAGVVALGVAELVAGLLAPSASPVVALADAVVDLTPPVLKDTAIQLFGTYDKAVLLTGGALVTLGLCAFAGRLAVRDTRYGTWLVLALGALAALAAATRPDATAMSVLPSLVGAAVGMAVLPWAVARTTGTGRAAPDPAGAQGTAAPVSDGPGPGRRAVTVGGLGMLGVGLFLGGRVLGNRLRDTDASRAGLTLPPPTDLAPALPSDVDVGVPGVSSFRTPNADFYRIDTALLVPRIRAEDWHLRIHGMVDREVTLDMPGLLAGGLIERDITLNCVSNEVGGDLIGNARWLGLPLGPLLQRAGPHSGADMVLSTSDDGWTCSTPLDTVTDGRDAMLAVAMNGEPLPLEHGFPVRMIVPGLYGFVSATKWVVDLEVTRFDQVEAYWTPRGWSERAPVKTASRIDVPRAGTAVPAGMVAVAGVAWAQHRGIRAVEVQVDRGPWQPARLAGEATVDTWRQWVLPWQATRGRHEVRVRAVDGTGTVQTGAMAPPAPDGATGWHTIDVEVD